MIRNYILVAIRNVVRNKFFSAINIFGLAVSMAICMAIIMLVADQMQYDRYNTKRHRIFRVNTFAVNEKGEDRSSMDNASHATAAPLRSPGSSSCCSSAQSPLVPRLLRAAFTNPVENLKGE